MSLKHNVPVSLQNSCDVGSKSGICQTDYKKSGVIMSAAKGGCIYAPCTFSSCVGLSFNDEHISHVSRKLSVLVSSDSQLQNNAQISGSDLKALKNVDEHEANSSSKLKPEPTRVHDLLKRKHSLSKIRKKSIFCSTLAHDLKYFDFDNEEELVGPQTKQYFVYRTSNQPSAISSFSKLYNGKEPANNCSLNQVGLNKLRVVSVTDRSVNKLSEGNAVQFLTNQDTALSSSITNNGDNENWAGTTREPSKNKKNAENVCEGLEKQQFQQQVGYICSLQNLQECARFPRTMGRVWLVHGLLKAYGLLECVKVIPCQVATLEDLKMFHSEEYVAFLSRVNMLSDIEREDLLEEASQFGLGYDCPLVPRLLDLVAQVAGATLTAAQALLDGKCQIAFNWTGGWHHAKRDEAAGFCYINDVVLGILRLRKKFQRILYVDLDLHHGDGVEEAFMYTSKVMCLSFHKYCEGFFPGTGSLSDVGLGKGRFYTINVPLKDGIRDGHFCWIVESVLHKVWEVYQPDAVVCQCGVDTLPGDPMASFNLTPKGVAACVKTLTSWKLPLILLGGGGYNFPNTARCWTYVMAEILEHHLEPDIPDHEYLLMYGPDYNIDITPGNRADCNTMEYLQDVLNTVTDPNEYIN
ncbi:histone deacetylase 8-like isoform X2 [Tachypleus tridentatus]|uniref:histone deacetylase 8-like isoform X2 n=1 Tax=Tachypleus tridentatus TaxID=6853 RepID=UPI003FD67301